MVRRTDERLIARYECFKGTFHNIRAVSCTLIPNDMPRCWRMVVAAEVQ
jgi:hypothetical protein